MPKAPSNTIIKTDANGAPQAATAGTDYVAPGVATVGSVVTPTLSLSGNVSAAAWTTSGIGLKHAARDLTDTSSSGTVAAAYTNVLGGNTLKASNATTYTEYGSLYVGNPTASTNVTISSAYSLVTAGAVKLGGSLVAGSIKPAADSTTAVQIKKDADSSAIVNVDTSNGRVGIGTTSPGATLHVNGAISMAQEANGGLYWGTVNSNRGCIKQDNTTYDWHFSTSGVADVLNIKSSNGNVGINNTAPGSKLEIKGAGTTSSSSSLNVTNSNGTSMLYVGDDGNVGIGTTSPGAKLDVVNNVAGLVRFSFSNPDTTAYQTTDIRIGRGTNSQDLFIGTNLGNVASGYIDNRTTGDFHICLSGTKQLTIDTNGAVSAFGTISRRGANAQTTNIKQLTELTTVAAAATTDTTIQIPAGAILLGVTARVVTAITCTSTFGLGINGATTKFGTGISKAANTTTVGSITPELNATAISVRITPDTTPADATGKIRITIHYLDITAATS